MYFSLLLFFVVCVFHFVCISLCVYFTVCISLHVFHYIYISLCVFHCACISVPPQAGPGGWAQQPAAPVGCPPGLEYLAMVPECVYFTVCIFHCVCISLCVFHCVCISVPPQAGPGGWAQQPSAPVGCPPGLEYLAMVPECVYFTVCISLCVYFTMCVFHCACISVPPQAGPGGWAQQPAAPVGCPPGLEYQVMVPECVYFTVLISLYVYFTVCISVPPQAGPGGWAQQPAAPVGCPPGLEYLAMVDQLLVKQKVEILESEFCFCYLSPALLHNVV